MKKFVITLFIILPGMTPSAFASEEVMANAVMCRGLERQSLQVAQDLKLQLQEDLRQYNVLKQIIAAEEKAHNNKFSFDPAEGSEQSLIDATLYQEMNASIERARSRLALLNQLCPGQATDAAAALKSAISAAEEQINALRSKSI